MFKINERIEQFIEDYVPLVRDREDRSFICRNEMVHVFLEVYGPSGMSPTAIKRQITVQMDRKYPMWNVNRRRWRNKTWMIGGTER